MPTYHHAWILATNRGATAPSSTAKTGLAYEAWPSKHGLLCFALALPKRDPRLDSLRHTYIHVRRLRASRSVAACGIDGQELAAHADRYLLASRFIVAWITTAWLVAVVAVLQQGSWRARRGLFVAHNKDIRFKVPWPRGVYLD